MTVPAPPSPSSDAAQRLFLGISVPDDVRAALEHHLHDARAAHAIPGRVVPPANWHLTLRFLGDTTPTQQEELLRQLRYAVLGPPFTLRLGGWGGFPRPRRAAVLWLGVTGGTEPLQGLARTVEDAAVRAGFAPEGRPFSAHLTLSRIRPPRDVSDLVQTLPAFTADVPVRDVTLFRSHLGAGPVRYQEVFQLPLG